MPTYDLTDGVSAVLPPENGMRKTFQVKKRITIPAASYASADVIKAIPVKAGWTVKGTSMTIVQAGGGTFTTGIGDGSGTSSYDAAADLAAVAGTEYHSAPGTDAYASAGGKYYAADDTIDLLLVCSAGSGTAIVALVADVIDRN